MKPFTLRETVAHVIRNGGITLDPTLGRPINQGYAVSPYRERERVLPLEDFNVKALGHYLVENKDLLNQPGNYLGVWWDRETDKVYLDVSLVVFDEGTCQELAVQHAQLAYYVLHEQKTVPMVANVA